MKAPPVACANRVPVIIYIVLSQLMHHNETSNFYLHTIHLLR